MAIDDGPPSSKPIPPPLYNLDRKSILVRIRGNGKAWQMYAQMHETLDQSRQLNHELNEFCRSHANDPEYKVSIEDLKVGMPVAAKYINERAKPACQNKYFRGRITDSEITNIRYPDIRVTFVDLGDNSFMVKLGDVMKLPTRFTTLPEQTFIAYAPDIKNFPKDFILGGNMGNFDKFVYRIAVREDARRAPFPITAIQSRDLETKAMSEKIVVAERAAKRGFNNGQKVSSVAQPVVKPLANSNGGAKTVEITNWNPEAKSGSINSEKSSKSGRKKKNNVPKVDMKAPAQFVPEKQHQPLLEPRSVTMSRMSPTKPKATEEVVHKREVVLAPLDYSTKNNQAQVAEEEDEQKVLDVELKPTELNAEDEPCRQNTEENEVPTAQLVDLSEDTDVVNESATVNVEDVENTFNCPSETSLLDALLDEVLEKDKLVEEDDIGAEGSSRDDDNEVASSGEIVSDVECDLNEDVEREAKDDVPQSTIFIDAPKDDDKPVAAISYDADSVAQALASFEIDFNGKLVHEVSFFAEKLVEDVEKKITVQQTAEKLVNDADDKITEDIIDRSVNGFLEKVWPVDESLNEQVAAGDVGPIIKQLSDKMAFDILGNLIPKSST